MEKPNQTLINKLQSIAEPGTEIELSPGEVDFLDLQTWDSADILDEGREDGHG